MLTETRSLWRRPILGFLAPFLCFGFLDVALAETSEPPRLFTLKLNDTTARIGEGQTVPVPGIFENPRATLIPDPHRTFAYGDVSFEYPAYFTFEAVIEGPHYKQWTLSGNDCKIMLFRLTSEFTPESFAAVLQKNLGTEGRLADCSVMLGERNYAGKEIKIEVGGAGFAQRALQITKDSVHRLLVLQSSSGSDADPEEQRLVEALLKKSFRILPPR